MWCHMKIILLRSRTRHQLTQYIVHECSKHVHHFPNVLAVSGHRQAVVLNILFRFDLFMHCDVRERDVRDFQETWSLPVLCVGGKVDDCLGDVSHLLNCLAEQLWHQDCVTARHQSQQETTTLL